jgi:hypothetical protein
MAAANRLYNKVTKISPRVSSGEIYWTMVEFRFPVKTQPNDLASSSTGGAILEILKWQWGT